jgi:hypothetical protein
MKIWRWAEGFVKSVPRLCFIESNRGAIQPGKELSTKVKKSEISYEIRTTKPESVKSMRAM